MVPIRRVSISVARPDDFSDSCDDDRGVVMAARAIRRVDQNLADLFEIVS